MYATPISPLPPAYSLTTIWNQRKEKLHQSRGTGQSICRFLSLHNSRLIIALFVCVFSFACPILGILRLHSLLPSHCRHSNHIPVFLQHNNYLYVIPYSTMSLAPSGLYTFLTANIPSVRTALNSAGFKQRIVGNCVRTCVHTHTQWLKNVCEVTIAPVRGFCVCVCVWVWGPEFSRDLPCPLFFLPPFVQ